MIARRRTTLAAVAAAPVPGQLLAYRPQAEQPAGPALVLDEALWCRLGARSGYAPAHGRIPLPRVGHDDHCGPRSGYPILAPSPAGSELGERRLLADLLAAAALLDRDQSAQSDPQLLADGGDARRLRPLLPPSLEIALVRPEALLERWRTYRAGARVPRPHRACGAEADGRLIALPIHRHPWGAGVPTIQLLQSPMNIDAFTIIIGDVDDAVPDIIEVAWTGSGWTRSQEPSDWYWSPLEEASAGAMNLASAPIHLDLRGQQAAWRSAYLI